MDTTTFKQKIKIEAENIGFKKFKNSFTVETKDSLIFLIPRKSGYSNKYYLRVKVELKPYNEEFNQDKYIRHDAGDVMLSLDSEHPKIFDLTNDISDLERSNSLEIFFRENVKSWINILSEKERIINYYRSGKLFLLPYTKNKIGIE